MAGASHDAFTGDSNGHSHNGGEKSKTSMNDLIWRVQDEVPGCTIFLRPIAPPAALGLAGFAGSTWITATWIAGWWGNDNSPTIFFPFVAFWGGLAQFLAGLEAFKARDTLTLIVCSLWGSFWMSIGLLYLLVATAVVPSHSIHTHFPELAAWFTVLAAFTWPCFIAAFTRDVTLAIVLGTLATGSTIELASFYAFNSTGVYNGTKAGAYFFIFSAIAAWWRVTVYILEEAYGPAVFKYNLSMRLPREKARPLLVHGLGEPGVRRTMPGSI